MSGAKVVEKKYRRRNQINFFLKSLVILFFVFAAGYLIATAYLDPSFFKRDLQEKYGQVEGVDLSVLIIGDPVKPLVQTEIGCDGLDPYVNLSWSADPLAASFDIEKDGEFLITGLTENEYVDDILLTVGTHQYIVTAVGINGTRISSDLVTINVAKCEVEPNEEDDKDDEEDDDKRKSPTCEIRTIDSINISSLSGTAEIKNQKPTFTGKTNLDKAKIRIEIFGETGFFAEIKANKNGFWKWQIPIELSPGIYKIKVKAIDQNNSSRYEFDSLVFRIKGETEEIMTLLVVEEKAPFGLEVEIQNPDKIIYAGGELILKTTINKFREFDSKTQDLVYEITDLEGNKLIEVSDRIKVIGDQKIYGKVDLSKLLKTGKYKIKVKASYENFNISTEDEFFLKEKPFIKLSTGQEITLTMILSFLSWISMLFLILFFIFLLLLFLEHRLAESAQIQITESFFEKIGFLGKRKEANK